MRIEEFDFTLPPSLIAQYPSAQRGDSRLMVLHRCRGEIEHRAFQDIGEYLQPGDLLVMNNSRVLPARLIGKRETGGTCEVLLIPSHHGMRDECDILIKRSRKVKSGTRIHFGAGLEGEVQEVKNGRGRIRLTANGDLLDRLQEIGHTPLPPYIRRQDEPLDRERYQTVVAERDGSIAAPTAGLHFTHGLLQRMRTQGVETALITLHVGIGTFAPVRVWNVEKHSMEPEWVDISEDVAHHIAAHKTERAKGHCGRNDDDAGLGVCFGFGGSNPAGPTDRWPFHLPFLSVSGCRWSRHQFPSAAIDPHHARVCLCGKGIRDASLSRSH